MKDSTTHKLAQIPPGYLMVGIDPHKRQHAAAVMTHQAQVTTKFKVANTMAGFKELRQRVDLEVQRQGASGAIYAIEAGAHFWRNLASFLDAEGRPFRLINPYTLKRRRDGEDLDRRKNDFRDAAMAAELLRTGKFTDTQLPQGVYAELRAAFHAYHRVRSQQTRVVYLILGLLDGLFPEFTQVFKEVTGKTALAVLALGPVPSLLSQMSTDEFLDRILKANPGQRLVTQKLRAIHAAAQESAGISQGTATIATEVQSLVEQVRLFQSQVQRWAERLTSLIARAPESRFLRSIPGVGPLTVAGLLGELGPLSRYRHGKQLVKMAGTNPTEAESAGKRSSHSPISKKGRPGLRWCLWLAGVSLLRHNPEFARWAKALRERPVNPLKGREAVVAVGNRLLRVTYALVKTQALYQAVNAQPMAA